ncbi:amidohydrolase family protein [Sphingomonas aerophila]|uniref:Imidazolonepropionase-like amidohydrolase n=1 Tax=Sphingomonas aerophila TaxID=1344948 RepID=A0A7W9EVN4_9SPHN|nr:amidohydrolase family protein [Sphingomonas aerophila]MBB5716509.1 imidazolonepropionase-like amidohydrolase [Sphingomonas aerophila]
MRRLILASLLATTLPSQIALAGPATKEQLLTPPAGARHYTVSSVAGKHGDVWQWKTPDGKLAYRMSMSLRGWVTETDEVVTVGPDRRPRAIAIRGFTDSGDATEDFSVDAGGVAHWKTAVDGGSAPFAGKRYNTYGGPALSGELDIEALVAAGDKGIDLLPMGHASIRVGNPVQIKGAWGTKAVKLAFVQGLGFAPAPVWLDEQNRFFGYAGITSLLPEGYEAAGPQLKDIQDRTTADMVRDVAHRFLSPANRTPTLVDHVLLFDSVAGTYLPDRAVLIADGKVANVGAAGSVAAPAGATVIDGRGKTLLPGLWDAHRHVGGDDWNLLQNVATGMTNYRSPGTMIDETLSIFKRRAAGDLLAPDGKVSVIIDRKDPLAAQGALTVLSADEAIAAVRKIKAAGMWGVKFYTSMTPAWIAPAAAEAHRLGLHVHGHVPAGMRPLDAVRAGYDEVTHINFIMMQAMPQEVVDKANTAARLEGPARYGKDVDLDSPEMKAFYAELAKRGTIIDPTLTVWEPLMTSDGTAIPPEYAPFASISPPSVARGWKIAGYPLSDGLTRDDYRKSFDKMVQLVGKLHDAGVPIVAGTDGYGLELVRELELYQQAGLSNAEALQTATIVPARMTGMADRTGSIAPGKAADIILVDGDVSRDLTSLRHIRTVFLDGYRLEGASLRQASGFSGEPQ